MSARPEGDRFLTLAGEGRAETRVKASRFLALAAPVGSDDEARERLRTWARPYFDATHHCSAWRLRGGGWRTDDDGEPAGSAGAPILAALDGAGLRDCLVVVTRYYGGTKLGVGGLVRAYGEAAALALAAAPRRAGIEAVRLRVVYGYEQTAAVMRTLDAAHARELEHGYTERGEGVALFTLARARVEALQTALRDVTAGRSVAERLGERVLYEPA